MNEAVLEAALIEQFELRADVVRQGAFAATNQDRAQEEMELIDKPGADRLAGEIAAPIEGRRSRTASAAGPRPGRTRARSESSRWMASVASVSRRSSPPPARSRRSRGTPRVRRQSARSPRSPSSRTSARRTRMEASLPSTSRTSPARRDPLGIVRPQVPPNAGWESHRGRVLLRGLVDARRVRLGADSVLVRSETLAGRRTSRRTATLPVRAKSSVDCRVWSVRLDPWCCARALCVHILAAHWRARH